MIGSNTAAAFGMGDQLGSAALGKAFVFSPVITSLGPRGSHERFGKYAQHGVSFRGCWFCIEYVELRGMMRLRKNSYL